MAVVKASYNLAWRGGPAASRSALGYMVRRPDLEGQVCDRSLFSAGRDALGEREGREVIEAARGNHHYRLILNPGAGISPDTDMREWTRGVMTELERHDARRILWVAVVHDNHAAHTHVHVVAVTEGRLDRGGLAVMREAADRGWEEELRLGRALRRDTLELEAVSPDFLPDQKAVPLHERHQEDEAAVPERALKRAGLNGPEVSL